jgi:SHS family lactate transporter-like MFS transporter
MLLGAAVMGFVANSIFGIVPTYLARRFDAEHRGLGVGIGWGMSSLSVGAPYVIASFTVAWGLPVAMTAFIIIGAFFAAITAAIPTEAGTPVLQAYDPLRDTKPA